MQSGFQDFWKHRVGCNDGGLGGSHAGGMPGGMNGRAGPRQDPPIEHQLPCTLEELYKGATKRMKISRSVTDVSGRTERVTETLFIDIKPGWKRGTKVTFPKKGSLHCLIAKHSFLLSRSSNELQCLPNHEPRGPARHDQGSLRQKGCHIDHIYVIICR